MIIYVDQTEITTEMVKRLGDVICIAPWTELDLNGEFEKEEQERRMLL